jgi:hypothetical protein
MPSQKAKLGHIDWLMWSDREGRNRREPKTLTTMKECLMDSGTKGDWLLVCANSGHAMRGFWRMGLNILAQMKRGYQ